MPPSLPLMVRPPLPSTVPESRWPPLETVAWATGPTDRGEARRAAVLDGQATEGADEGVDRVAVTQDDLRSAEAHLSAAGRAARERLGAATAAQGRAAVDAATVDDRAAAGAQLVEHARAAVADDLRAARADQHVCWRRRHRTGSRYRR